MIYAALVVVDFGVGDHWATTAERFALTSEVSPPNENQVPARIAGETDA